MHTGYGKGGTDQVEEGSPIVEAESKIKCEIGVYTYTEVD